MHKGDKVLVLGTGVSGISATRLLTELGMQTTIYDENKDADLVKIAERLGEVASCVSIVSGAISDQQLAAMNQIVISPGVPIDAPFVLRALQMGLPVIGEIELSCKYAKGKLIAITGTNGKTTTTTLVGDIMKRYHANSFVVGNIGYPYTAEALRTSDDSVTVAEISSFQLETTRSMHAQVSAILNITPDHLNRHYTMECYQALKESITQNQTEQDYCILNYDNPYTRDFGSRCKAQVVWFSSKDCPPSGYFMEGNRLCYQEVRGDVQTLMTTDQTSLVGTCNYENIMAAIAMTSAMGVPMEVILESVYAFHAVEHRIEFVAEKMGVKYYNDSKGTNPDAAIQGIRAMERKTVLIAGGYDKDNEYDEWVEAFDGKVKALLLMGVTKDKIAKCAREHGLDSIYFVESMEEAVKKASAIAEPGDAVLLSPACASWDMFLNYEERGRIFKEAVNAIAK